MHFAERFQVCEMFLPGDVAGSAKIGDWVDLSGFQACHVLVYLAPGLAAEPATISITQAKDATGTDAIALNFTTGYKKQAATDLRSTAGWTRVDQSPPDDGFVLGSGADGDKAAIVSITILASWLDTNNGYRFVRAAMPDVGTGPAMGAGLYILEGGRYNPPGSALG